MSYDHWRLRWPRSTVPMPSAFALLAVPAHLGRWERRDLVAVLGQSIHAHGPPYLGWGTLSHPTAMANVCRLQQQREAVVRYAADLWRWWPPSLRKLLQGRDPTTYSRLRFCESCLSRGDHSPLFQLPWWDNCPVHAGPLCESCPDCDTPIPAGLPSATPALWLTCGHCGHELCDRAFLAHLHEEPSRRNNDRWWQVIGAYRRWLDATRKVQFAQGWMVHGDGTGTLENVATVAVRHLLTLVPASAPLQPHLLTLPCTARTEAGVWSRKFIERLQLPRVKSLGFSSRLQMQHACRHFYGALPITEECRRILAACHRHLRRQIKVRVVGWGAPNALPDTLQYVWKGPRPWPVLGFRLLTDLAQTDRVEGVAYLDFRAVALLLEPPVYLAQRVLARLTGLDLEDLRTWPKDMLRLVSDPAWVVRTNRKVPPSDLRPRPLQALSWLYDRLMVESWRDIANECFSRARPGGVMAWDIQYAIEPILCPPGRLFFRARPLCVGGDANQAEHPLLLHARTVQSWPRTWAAAVLRTSTNRDKETYTALWGRAVQEPFAPVQETSFRAQWIWPEELPPGDVRGDDAASTSRQLSP